MCHKNVDPLEIDKVSAGELSLKGEADAAATTGGKIAFSSSSSDTST